LLPFFELVKAMKCDVCSKGEIRTKVRQTYRYKECGLDNVYLLNIEFRVCDACGIKVPRLKSMPELHATIARAIAMQPCSLRGQDIRFLRKQLGYSAREWATLLRTDASTLSRWENDQQEIGTQSDTLIRLLYFRIRDEKEGTLSKERVATAAAAVSTGCFLNLCVNMNDPSVYSYKIRTARFVELAT
jgi:putative zinc finger/helix-turn-helix YgiT family protein